MIQINGNNISMSETDFGQTIPLGFEGNILSTDVIKFSIKENVYSKELVLKEFKDLQVEDGICNCNLMFTKDETDKLKSGDYLYGIALYRDDKLKCNIVDFAKFEVREVVQK